MNLCLQRLINIMLLVLMILSCDSKKKSNNVEIRLDIKNLDENQLIPKKIIKNIRFIPFETNKKNLLTGIAKMYKYNDYFFIQDKSYTQAIIVYNKDGTFINSIGKYGKGPGEAISFTDFTIDKDQNMILILDHDQRKILFFDLHNFNYIKQLRYDNSLLCRGITKVGHNTLSFYSNHQSYNKTQYKIVNMNVENKSLEWFLEKDECDINVGYKHAMFESNNQYFVSFFDNIIYKLSENGPKPYIYLDFGKKTFPCESVKENQHSDVIQKLKEKKWIYGVNNVIDNDNILTFSFKYLNSSAQFLYSKTSGKYYGMKYTKEYFLLDFVEILASDENYFYGIIDGFVFKRMKKRIQELPNCPLKAAYNKTFNGTIDFSSQIVVLIEYNKF